MYFIYNTGIKTDLNQKTDNKKERLQRLDQYSMKIQYVRGFQLMRHTFQPNLSN